MSVISAVAKGTVKAPITIPVGTNTLVGGWMTINMVKESTQILKGTNIMVIGKMVYLMVWASVLTKTEKLKKVFLKKVNFYISKMPRPTI